MMLKRSFIWTTFAMSLLLSPATANAQAAPPGVKMANGALADPSGMPLYTFNNDTMKGMSHCRDDCAKAWPPFLADPTSRPVGDWTIIVREGGARQWAYKDKPLYTFPADKPGSPGAGETAGQFKLAR